MSQVPYCVIDFTIQSQLGSVLFSRRVPDFCDGRWSFPTNENSNSYRRGRRRWISLITNPLNCWASVPQSRKFQFLAHFPFPAKLIGRIWVWLVAIIRYIWDGRQKVKSPIVWDFPDIRKPGLKSKPPPLRINILFSPRTLGGLVNFAEQLACVTCVALGATHTSSCAGCREGFRVLGWYRSFVELAVNYCFWVIQHSENFLWTAISGRDPFKNFGPKLNGSVGSNRKSFEKRGPPFEVVLFSRSDQSEFWLNGSRPVFPARIAGA